MAVAEDSVLLSVENLRTYFYTPDAVVKAVDGVDFAVRRGETLGVVGESGCGKSVTSFSIMGLVPRPRGKIVGGHIYYHGADGAPVDIASLKAEDRQLRRLRGNEISMIFQEPGASMTPVYTIGEQIMESTMLHLKFTRQQARKHAIEMLGEVGIANPGLRVDDYPHQLSGGMVQRAMIAMALSCEPKFLIADEPTTALDVTIEAQILELMRDLQDRFDMSIMIITHDLGVVGEMADRVTVMYAGQIMESATTDAVFYEPKHPYTEALLDSIPQIGDKRKLVTIPGTVPNLANKPPGCPFQPRCAYAMDMCSEEPPQFQIGEGHTAKCWLYSDSHKVGVS